MTRVSRGWGGAGWGNLQAKCTWHQQTQRLLASGDTGVRFACCVCFVHMGAYPSGLGTQGGRGDSAPSTHHTTKLDRILELVPSPALGPLAAEAAGCYTHLKDTPGTRPK